VNALPSPPYVHVAVVPDCENTPLVPHGAAADDDPASASAHSAANPAATANTKARQGAERSL
jgi:hypothetical protein